MRGQKITMILTVIAAGILWSLMLPRNAEPQFYEAENTSYIISVRDAEPETITVEEIEDPVNYIEGIPLNEDIQEYIFKIADETGLHPYLIFAMIEVESDYIIDATGDNGESIGLMQVQPRWHSARMEELNVNNLYDPIGNITVGIDYFMDCVDACETVEEALVMYNTGSKGNRNHYSEEVINTFTNMVVNYGTRENF